MLRLLDPFLLPDVSVVRMCLYVGEKWKEGALVTFLKNINPGGLSTGSWYPPLAFTQTTGCFSFFKRRKMWVWLREKEREAKDKGGWAVWGGCCTLECLAFVLINNRCLNCCFPAHSVAVYTDSAVVCPFSYDASAIGPCVAVSLPSGVISPQKNLCHGQANIFSLVFGPVITLKLGCRLTELLIQWRFW